ncbi:MAG: cbb3-type cytochrome c oxidase subunit 3 [Rubellimicrobium sp.]|nr:cbb3-type cytochrome c oxidase subunit 3 [Rubellimicrobium sp.]
MDLHSFLVLMAKTFGLLWMMAMFLGAAWYAYRPANRDRHEAAGRSVLDAALMARDRQ